MRCPGQIAQLALHSIMRDFCGNLVSILKLHSIKIASKTNISINKKLPFSSEKRYDFI